MADQSLFKRLSQPRSELLAATVNAHTGEVVKRLFGEFHKRSIKITDSQVALYGNNNDTKPLKQWVRNRMREIWRFTDPANWKITLSEKMIADIGSRRVQDLKNG